MLKKIEFAVNAAGLLGHPDFREGNKVIKVKRCRSNVQGKRCTRKDCSYLHLREDVFEEYFPPEIRRDIYDSFGLWYEDEEPESVPI